MGIECVSLLLLVFFINNNVQAARILQAQMQTYDVTKYGGVADGKTDNSKAFTTTWNEACQNQQGGVVLFPQGTFLLSPLEFDQTCKGPMEFQVQGTILASREMQYSVGIDHWILFNHITNFVISGGGTFDGQGASAWPHNDCRINPHCRALPATLTFNFCHNTKILNINSLNSKNAHIIFYGTENVTISNVNITAPGDSPNTDGIKFGESKNIEILDTIISTGDDCLALLPTTNNITVTDVYCGPGHGISLGSMDSGSITDMVVTNCSFSGTENGVRIKTKNPSQQGIVSNITFHHIQMDNVDNPIVIDQLYCPGGGCPQSQPSEIQINDVKYMDIRGTSNTETVVSFRCSQNRPCTGIKLRDINLTYNQGKAKQTCLNAKGVSSGRQHPPSCLQR